MKNTVTLVGFVGNNPEVRTTQSGASITTVSLATTNSFKDSEGNRQTETEWHRITSVNGIGKCVADHVAKSALLMVTGRTHHTTPTHHPHPQSNPWTTVSSSWNPSTRFRRTRSNKLTFAGELITKPLPFS